MNRLGSASSPYLLQHKDNPVAWWEWSDEAFAEAKRRDVPIFLSVGYAACHWCHVMAHDSFENDQVAAVLNEHYVSVKVDREERPDVDSVYMDATVALTGQGGWPMTCLLTPDREPFFAGTFFPRAQFLSLLNQVAQAWQRDRAGVIAAGQRVATALAELGGATTFGADTPVAAELDDAARTLLGQADRTHGGFGGAPKFPPSMVLEFLLRHHERTGDEAALAIAGEAFEAMARGGMYDQLASGPPGSEGVAAGGGFARYSVDVGWVVPHFEKMLYDNAQLLRGYLHWWRLTGNPLGERVARETAEFLLRDLGTEQGGLASALDADAGGGTPTSEGVAGGGGVEGLTYVWTPGQLRDVLGEDDGRWAAELFGVSESGTFEHGASTLQLRRDPDDPVRYADVRARLLAARSTRPQPARDDKVVTAWNGLAIAALAEAGVLLGEPRYLAAANGIADLILRVHLVQGRLRRTSLGGEVGAALAVAEDYGDLAEGLLALHQASADPSRLTAAGALLDAALELFADADSGAPVGAGAGGGFFDTGVDAEQLIRRPRDPSDNAAPSGNSALAGALLGYSALTGSLRHREAAEQALRVVTGLGARQPRFFGWALAVAEAAIAGPVQVAIVGEDGYGPLTATAWRQRPPGAVVVAGAPDAEGVPLLADRPLVAGGAAAYVCRGMVCDRPVTDAAALAAALGRVPGSAASSLLDAAPTEEPGTKSDG